MKKYKRLHLILLITLLVMIYPTQRKILYGNFYHTSDEQIDESLFLKMILLKNNEHNFNEIIYEDSKISVSQIITYDQENYMDIVVKINTNWNILKGNFVGVDETSEDNHIAKIRYDIVDDKLNSIYTGIATYQNEKIYLRIENIEKMYDLHNIAIKFDDLIETEYELKAFKKYKSYI